MFQNYHRGVYIPYPSNETAWLYESRNKYLFGIIKSGRSMNQKKCKRLFVEECSPNELSILEQEQHKQGCHLTFLKLPSSFSYLLNLETLVVDMPKDVIVMTNCSLFFGIYWITYERGIHSCLQLRGRINNWRSIYTKGQA